MLLCIGSLFIFNEIILEAKRIIHTKPLPCPIKLRESPDQQAPSDGLMAEFSLSVFVKEQSGTQALSHAKETAKTLLLMHNAAWVRYHIHYLIGQTECN